MNRLTANSMHGFTGPVSLTPGVSANRSFAKMQRLDPRWWRFVVALGLFQATFVAWVLIRPGGLGVLTYFDDIALVIGATIAAAAGTAAVKRYWRSQSGAAWLAITAGLWMTAFGEAAWGFQELAMNREVPFPSVADIGYLGLYPLVFLGLLLMPQAPLKISQRIRLSVDLLMGIGALALVSWQLVLREPLADESLSSLADTIGLAYPFSDLLIAFAVLALILRGGRGLSTVSLLLLGCGFLSIALSDSLYTYLTQLGTYSSGSYVDIGWLAGYNLVTVSAVLAAGRGVNFDQVSHDESAVGPGLQSMVVYTPLLPLVALVVIEGNWSHSGTILFTGFLGVLVLAFVRQVMTAVENQALNQQLRKLTEEMKTTMQTQRLDILRQRDEIRQQEDEIRHQERILSAASESRPESGVQATHLGDRLAE